MPPLDDLPFWLALLNGRHIKRQQAKALIGGWCLDGHQPLSALWELQRHEVAAQLNLDESALSHLNDVKLAAYEWRDRLQKLHLRGIDGLTRVDAAYPDSLAQRLPEERLPYTLFYSGGLELLSEPPLAIFTGAHVSPAGRALAEQLATTCAENGYPLLALLDAAAPSLARAALEAQGQITLLLAAGLEEAWSSLTLVSMALQNGTALALSPYLPDQKTSPALVNASLGLTTALAEVVFLVEPHLGPADWPNYEHALAGGVRFLVATQTASSQVEAWTAAGALPFADAAQALNLLSAQVGVPLWDEKGGDIDAVPGVEPIAFENADQAIAALSTGGHVPPALARRLRDSEWPGDLYVFDTDEPSQPEES